MRWLVVFVAFSLWSDPAEACVSHQASPQVKLPKKSTMPGVEPAFVVIVGVDMGRRFTKTLENIGHDVTVVKDASELETGVRYDIAIATPETALQLLQNLSVSMVVPVGDGADDAPDFEHVVPSDPSELKQQIHVFHRALALRPQPIRRGYLVAER